MRERQEAYEGMGALATRIQNAFASCATKNEAANAKSYTDKIRGGGHKKAAEATDEKSRSTSQMSFDNSGMKNLRDYCRFLATIHFILSTVSVYQATVSVQLAAASVQLTTASVQLDSASVQLATASVQLTTASV